MATSTRAMPLTGRNVSRIVIVYLLHGGWGIRTKIQKWGNSLGLRIPKSFAAEAQVAEGSTVNLSVERGRLLVRPLRTRKYVLGDLLKQINSRNVHREVSTGEPVGREAW